VRAGKTNKAERSIVEGEHDNTSKMTSWWGTKSHSSIHCVFSYHHVAPKSMTTSFCSDPALRIISSTSWRDSGSNTCPPRMLRTAGSCRETPKIEGACVCCAQEPTGETMGVFVVVATVVGTMAKSTAMRPQNRTENIVIIIVVASF
jgi:hypothetical protein